MFTGIIEELGTLSATTTQAQGGRITISAQKVRENLKIGDSIAINGVCLTAVAFTNQTITFDVSAETLARTTLGGLRPGAIVNLERALQASDRLGGHIVQGHVDGVGKFVSSRLIGESYIIRVAFPSEIGQYICHKGSIALEGISLTVAQLGDSWFEVAVIPHTWQITSLSHLKPGQAINLEVDIVAKYIERMLTYRQPANSKPALTLDRLRDLGY